MQPCLLLIPLRISVRPNIIRCACQVFLLHFSCTKLWKYTG